MKHSANCEKNTAVIDVAGVEETVVEEEILKAPQTPTGGSKKTSKTKAPQESLEDIEEQA